MFGLSAEINVAKKKVISPKSFSVYNNHRPHPELQWCQRISDVIYTHLLPARLNTNIMWVAILKNLTHFTPIGYTSQKIVLDWWKLQR